MPEQQPILTILVRHHFYYRSENWMAIRISLPFPIWIIFLKLDDDKTAIGREREGDESKTSAMWISDIVEKVSNYNKIETPILCSWKLDESAESRLHCTIYFV